MSSINRNLSSQNDSYLATKTPRSVSPVDLRIAISDEIGFCFRHTVLSSNSNTNSAIYFRKHHLKAIAQAVCPPSCEYDSMTASQLRDTIRNSVAPLVNSADRQTSTREYFLESDLRNILNSLDINPDDITPYLTPELRQLAGGAINGEYYHTLLEETYATVYLSANLGSGNVSSRIYYPYVMQPVHEIPQSATNPPNCHRYIVDSSYDKPGINNEDAIDAAMRVNADAVVLADVYHNPRKTIEKLHDGIKIAESFDGEIILPLQPPIQKSVRMLIESSIPHEKHRIAIGGLRHKSPEMKVKAAKQARSMLGEDVDLHGLGYGVTQPLIRAFKQNPNLLNSIDYSTPIQEGLNSGKSGKERMLSAASTVNSILVDDLRRFSPLVQNENSTYVQRRLTE